MCCGRRGGEVFKRMNATYGIFFSVRGIIFFVKLLRNSKTCFIFAAVELLIMTMLLCLLTCE